MLSQMPRSWFVATFALAGCAFHGASESGDQTEFVETEAQAFEPVELGTCYMGMTTEVIAVDPTRPRCSLKELPEFVQFACATSPELCFFLDKLNGNAQIQCSRHKVDGQEVMCADVIDRDPTQQPLHKEGEGWANFFVAYASDLRHDDYLRNLWADYLAAPEFYQPPVELSSAGYIDIDGDYSPAGSSPPQANKGAWRLYKFDPRTCASCGIYQSPNRYLILDSAFLSRIYDANQPLWPTFDATACRLQKDLQGGTLGLNRDQCLAEQNYRATSR